MTLEITSTSTDGVPTIALAGDLDLATRGVLADALADLAPDGTHRVIVDLAQLRFLDSTGIGVLVAAAVAAREAGGWVRIREANGTPLRALEITGVIDLLTGSVTPVDEPS